MNALPSVVQDDSRQRYLRGMERLVLAVQELSLARDLPAVMAAVRCAAREITGADGATFVLRDGAHCFYADEEAIAPLWKGRRFPLQSCISGWAMLNRSAVAIEDIYADPRIPHDAYRPTFVKSLAMVPVRSLDPIAAIGNYWAHVHAPSAEEMRLLQALADTTAVALENVQVYAELEQRVLDRTRALEARNAELDAFVSAVTHDLRAPLRRIQGFTELLAAEAAPTLSEEAHDHLARIRRSVGQMGRLIDALLGLSRVGQQALRVQAVDLAALANGILADLAQAEPERRVCWQVEEPLVADGDPHLLEVLLQNLLANAWKFTARARDARIEVDALTQGEGQRVFRVADNGAGFDMSQAHRLFGVFQRLHAEADYPGTGVGLATVQRIVERHGGRVWAEGAPGQGARFCFRLGGGTGTGDSRGPPHEARSNAGSGEMR